MSGSHPHARQIVASVFIMLWGARLSGFLLFRILKTGKDDRFDDKRDRFFPFLGFWVFQMLWVWVVSLPVTIINSPAATAYPYIAFGTGRDIAGVILFALGFIIESVGDVEKYIFRQRADKSAVCDKGFWGWSRHPNYFGEIIIQFCKYLDLLGFFISLCHRSFRTHSHFCHFSMAILYLSHILSRQKTC